MGPRKTSYEENLMAKSKKVSLKDRLRKTSVREKTRTADVQVPGGGSLPAGVTGVAKLTRLDFDEITQGVNAGSQRFYCHGVCVTPKTFKDADGNVHDTAGSLVQLSRIVLDDTEYNGKTTSFEENFAKAENRLKLLGIPTEDIDDDDFEGSVLQYVAENEIFFKFRTWKSDDSRVNVVLTGSANPPEDGDEEEEVEEEEVQQTPSKAEKSKSKAEPKKAKATPKKEPEPEVEEEEEEEEEDTNFDPTSLRKIGKLADKGDEKLQTDIADMAEDLGIDTTVYDDWYAVVEAIIEAKSGAEAEEEESDEEEQDDVVPEKGDIFLYNGDECEVTIVFPQSNKVTLKNLTNNKIVKNISWSDLEVIS